MSKKKIIIIVLIAVFALLLGIFLRFFVFPRLVVIALDKPKDLRYTDLEKVELDNTYQGEAYEVNVRGITFKLPYDTEEDDELYLYDPDSMMAEIRKYEYRVWLSRIKKEPLYDDVEITESISHLLLGASSFNEYHVKIHEYEFEEPSILLPPEELSIKYNIYKALATYWSTGNYYDVMIKDDYSIIVTISDRDSRKGKPDEVEIDIYDNTDYAHIANLSILKDYFTFETIAYIVDSIEVDDY